MSKDVNQPGYEAFLFDMDGTILDSTAPSERAWSGWAWDNGIPTPPYHGRRVEDTMADLADAGIDPVKGAAEVMERELTDLEGVVAIPGAEAFLAALPAGKWAVVTSAPRELALRRMAAAGLPLPQAIIAAEDVTVGKPMPDPFLAGARLLSVQPDQCLVFEDADAGIMAAEAAGAAVMVIAQTGNAHLPGRESVNNYLELDVQTVDNRLVLKRKEAG